MQTKKRTPTPKTVWAYAYQILPPQPAARLHSIKSLLDHAHAEAQRDARTWTGRVVVEEQVTHILIVSDSPEQNHEGNRKLEAKLQELNAGFSITVPIAVADETATPVTPDDVAPASDLTGT
jgi:crotonobetainyl-CoA:carnitine CoA-transferase CaiB-like acyl-CoA transferase